MTFTEFNLKKPINDAIAKAGYKEPSPIQAQAIPAMLDGRDMIACAQTGTGKTAAFALPVLNKLPVLRRSQIRALVVTPTRELAIQIFDNFKKCGRYMKLRSACVYGGAGQGAQIAALSRGCDILVATPGRLMDFMNQGVISLDNIEILILDEADRMLDMGFIGDIRKIAAKTPAERQTVMFSATMPKEIEKLALELLRDPVDIRVAATSSPADTVDQKITFAEKANKKYVLSSFLRRPEVKKSIVFTRTKYGADKLVKELKREGIDSLSIHGDKTQGQRQNALERFRSGNIKVLVATDVAARGIDIPKITHVYNYELPMEAESYIHRIGRAGRAGQEGEAISICCEEEMERLYDIEKLMKREIPETETEWTVKIEKFVPKSRRLGGSKGGNRSGNKNGNRRRPSAKADRPDADKKIVDQKNDETVSKEKTNARPAVKAETKKENFSKGGFKKDGFKKDGYRKNGYRKSGYKKNNKAGSGSEGSKTA